MFTILNKKVKKKHIYPAIYQSKRNYNIFLFVSEFKAYKLTSIPIGELFEDCKSCKNSDEWKRIAIEFESFYPDGRQIKFPIICRNSNNHFVLFFSVSHGIYITPNLVSLTKRLRIGKRFRHWICSSYLKTWFPVNLTLK